MNRLYSIVSMAILVGMLTQCKEKYISPYVSPATGYLVVDGYICGNGPTSFYLSRTIKLSADTVNPQELNATLQVEGDEGSVFPLSEKGAGLYTLDTLPVIQTAKYRLRVKTSAGEEYLSDFVPFKQTPAIDSISWALEDGGVTIFANTHDDRDSTRYYQWNYDETWEYHSAEESGYKYDKPTTSVILRPPAEEIFRCWRGRSSTSIMIGTSAKLASDVIYKDKLYQVPANSEQISVRYSVLVRQYALAADGYEFLDRMKKNTESLGSIFDAQPSQLNGNIHSVSHPTEIVIGFVNAGTVQQKRIYINRGDVSPWYFSFSCLAGDTLVPPNAEAYKKFYEDEGFIPVDIHYSRFAGFDGYLSNDTYCIDCRVQGGSTVQPSFWTY